MKVKTSELIGFPLNWVVAKCEGIILTQDGYIEYVVDHLNSEYTLYSPSTDWAQGGPIIEREEVETRKANTKEWGAWKENVGCIHGSTLLVAAMRCYVASKFGDEVDLDLL